MFLNGRSMEVVKEALFVVGFDHNGLEWFPLSRLVWVLFESEVSIDLFLSFFTAISFDFVVCVVLWHVLQSLCCVLFGVLTGLTWWRRPCCFLLWTIWVCKWLTSSSLKYRWNWAYIIKTCLRGKNYRIRSCMNSLTLRICCKTICEERRGISNR